MDVGALTSLIANLGFPIACVLGMAWFIYQIFTKTTAQQEANMEKVQKRCQEREDKLYSEIKENREINAQAISTIALYADKLGVIQKDIEEIKVDVIRINENLNH